MLVAILTTTVPPSSIKTGGAEQPAHFPTTTTLFRSPQPNPTAHPPQPHVPQQAFATGQARCSTPFDWRTSTGRCGAGQEWCAPSTVSLSASLTKVHDLT
jgi:hypothetical protein